MPDILLAEDKVSLRHALRMTLENAGYESAETPGIRYKTLLTKIKEHGH
jgi:DNA-binding NtrC family response regulator